MVMKIELKQNKKVLRPVSVGLPSRGQGDHAAQKARSPMVWSLVLWNQGSEQLVVLRVQVELCTKCTKTPSTIFGLLQSTHTLGRCNVY